MTENWRKWRWKEISPFSVNGDWTTTKNQTKRQEKNWEHKNGQIKRRRKRKETDHRKKESKAKQRKRGKKRKKVYSTRYSQAVTHPSTNLARRCLTSVIGREPVFSTWYGRRHLTHSFTPTHTQIHSTHNTSPTSNSTTYVIYSLQRAKIAFSSQIWLNLKTRP